jgi:hypothetical protein
MFRYSSRRLFHFMQLNALTPQYRPKNDLKVVTFGVLFMTSSQFYWLLFLWNKF